MAVGSAWLPLHMAALSFTNSAGGAVEPLEESGLEAEAVGRVKSAVGNLRNASDPVSVMRAFCGLEAATMGLLRAARNHPELASDKRLSAAEDDIAHSRNTLSILRRQYNEVVQQMRSRSGYPFPYFAACGPTSEPEVRF
jgi:hypothetical protein